MLRVGRFHSFVLAAMLASCSRLWPDTPLQVALHHDERASISQGYMRNRTGENFPMIIGYDIAGVIDKAGANVTKLKPGDAVYAYLTLNGGGYAEYAVASENEAGRKPKALTFEEAAAVPLAGETAWQALIETAKLESGQTVLIHGGSGGV